MSLSIDEIEKKLNTSAASGLSRKAARGRLQKIGKNNFFILPQTSIADCVRSIIAQPSMILLLLLDALLIIFRQTTQGKHLFCITIAYITALVAMRLWTERIYRISSRTSRPLIKVIREGQLFLLDSSQLVPGDLVELETGDMAPCDLRLVHATEIRVLTYLGHDHTVPSYARSIKSYSEDGLPYVAEICEQGNMIYGGSMIEMGFGRALVVETGIHTYIGALQGGYPIIIEKHLPGNAEKMKRIASQMQIFLLLTILPIMCLCLLLQKSEIGLPYLFATLLCLCLANLTGHMETVLNFGMAIGVRRAMNTKESDNLALIKTDKSPDTFTEIDFLFLLGTQALSEQSIPTTTSNASGTLISRNDVSLQRRALQFVLGEHFLSTREHDIASLREAGIQPILIMPEETRDTITYIMRSGIVDNASEIALASRFHATKMPITNNAGKYRAYCGFPNEELRLLMISLQKDKKRVAVLASNTQEASILKHADVRFVGVDDLKRFIDPLKARNKKPELNRPDEGAVSARMRQNADILVPYAKRKCGGLASVLRALYLASDVTHNLILMARYLIYTQMIRILFIVPTILLGFPLIQPIQTAFSGLCVDLVLSCILLCRVGQHRPSEIGDLPRDTRKTTYPAACFTAIVTLLCFWGIHTYDPNASAASSALYFTMLVIQITFFFICWNPIVSLKKATNRRYLITILGSALLLLTVLAIFDLLPYLDLANLSAPYGYLPLIGFVSTILGLLIIHLYRSGISR